MKTPIGVVRQPVNKTSANKGRQILSDQLSPKAIKGFRLIFYIGCATSLILVILLGIISYNSLNRQQALEKRVEHTYQVLRKTDSISSFFNQALVVEQYTNPLPGSNPTELDGKEHRQLTGQLNALKKLVQDNSVQLQRIVLLQKQIDELWKTTAHQAVGANTDQIRTMFNGIKQTEEILLSNRENAYKRSGKQTQVIVVAGSVLILLIVSFLIYMILTELNNRFRAHQKEHELNQLKSSFVTLASHEFRTPLSSVLLSASLIEKYVERAEKEPIVKHAAKIKQVVYNLEGILEDFLSLEKLEAGQVKAKFTFFDLETLCLEIMKTVKAMAKPGQQLTYERCGGTEMVCLDRTLIEKAITSLLFNAIQYAGEKVCIKLITNVEAGRVVISVKDNGIGIGEEDQKKLSMIFFRINNSGNIPGTGLGLNIVKRYVQLMNGTLRFSSAPHEETCFEMAFPVIR